MLPSAVPFSEKLFPTRAAYTSAYEHFSYAYPSPSGVDPASFDETVADYIEEEYEDAPSIVSLQKILNLLNMFSITFPPLLKLTCPVPGD